MPQDEDLQQRVRDELRCDSRVASALITVLVTAGVVTLSGEVDALPTRTAAARAAARVPGVVVANEIVVRLPANRRRSDADVVHDASLALIRDLDDASDAIQARAQGGWIWLLGTVDREEHAYAACRGVQSVLGVRGVTNLVRARRR